MKIKPILFRHSPQSEDKPVEMKNVLHIPKKRRFEHVGKKLMKLLSIVTLTTIASVTALMVINSFFMSYYFSFQSPVILQPPIVLQQRQTALLSPVGKGFVAHAQEETQEGENIEPKKETLHISERGVGCVNRNPGLSTKIKETFGQDWQLAAELICRESGFNPGAINPTSGACGLAQALPCKKMQCELADVDCQLTWIKDYVEKRYGTMGTALAFHDEHNWY